MKTNEKNVVLIKHFVKVLLHGKVYDYSKIYEVKSKSIKKIKIPKTAYGYYFFDLYIKNYGNELKIFTEEKNITPTTYIGKFVSTSKQKNGFWNRKKDQKESGYVLTSSGLKIILKENEKCISPEQVFDENDGLFEK